MNFDIFILLITLVITFVLFIINYWRFDIVAIGALLFLTSCKIVPANEAFSGFSNPAVITVIAVLIMGKGLQNSGLLDFLAKAIAQSQFNFTLQLAILCFATAFLSAFINNVGALVVIMPVVLKIASERQVSPSLYLMPIAFSSLLGGLTTLIGTPPNIIVSSFRQEIGYTDYFLFDFAYVGLPVAIIGILFLSTVGWRLIPLKGGAINSSYLFEVGDYLTEITLPKQSKFIGKTFGDLNSIAEDSLELLVRASSEGKRLSTGKTAKLNEEDILVISGPQEALHSLLEGTDLKLVTNQELLEKAKDRNSHHLVEAVVLPDSSLVGRMPRPKTLSSHFKIALLALARRGRKIRKRLSRITIKPGDVLLLRGEDQDIANMIHNKNCLPLVSRDIQVSLSSFAYYALAFFLSSILLVIFKVFPPEVALTIGAALMVAKGVVPVGSVYKHIDWSIVVLLGALLPVGRAIETTGAAQMIVSQTLIWVGSLGPNWILAFLLISVMFLSDVVNNAAAAALAAPIALQVANTLDVSPDPFLMAIGIGASCAFLTPIGHQSNALVMGPGGYEFKDYWRLGLPLELLIFSVSIPALLYFWPLS